jgi:hypothetical protein
MIEPIAAGNALRIFTAPMAGADYWRVLKKATNEFLDVDDTVDALVAYEGSEAVFIDADYNSLPNDIAVFYRIYYHFEGDAWVSGNIISGTPSARYIDKSVDVMGFVRGRIEAGLKVECERENFQTELGYIQVYTAPPSLEQGILFPCVTMSVEHDNIAERGIGEDPIGDYYDDVEDEHLAGDGWLSSVSLSITGWSLNSDERVELRKALKRVITANLAIFDYVGIQQVDLSLSDVDAISGEFDAPLYQVNCTMSCVAPVFIARSYSNPAETINEISVEVSNG